LTNAGGSALRPSCLRPLRDPPPDPRISHPTL